MNTISRILAPSITLLCPLVGSSLASQIGSDFQNRTGCSTMFCHQVVVYYHSVPQILMFCHCICTIKGNEHYQQDSRALHHTFVSACWHLSCLRLGQIFKIEHSLRQCLAIKWWYTLILFLRY